MNKKERKQFEGLNVDILDNKYNISADVYQFILKNKKTSKTTYHSTFVGVLQAIKEDELRAMKSKDLPHLLYEIRELNKTMIEIKDALEKGVH